MGSSVITPKKRKKCNAASLYRHLLAFNDNNRNNTGNFYDAVLQCDMLKNKNEQKIKTAQSVQSNTKLL